MGALMALLPLALQFVPEIASLLGGPAAGTALGHVADAAQAAFGTIDAEQIKLKIQEDASSADKFKAELQGRLSELHEQLADLQSARGQTVSLVQAGSLIAWGAPIVSVLVVTGFFVIVMLMMIRTLNITDTGTQILLVMLGALASGFQQVIAYWLGSSAGSKDKDALMAHMATASTASAAGALTQTAATVKKMFR